MKESDGSGSNRSHHSKRGACSYILCRSDGRRPRVFSPQWHTDTVYVVLLTDELLRRDHESIQAQHDAERRRAPD